MTTLGDTSERALLHNLRARFAGDEIYTNVGDILVSTNPYKALSIFTDQIRTSYRAVPAEVAKLAPHIYQISERAFYGTSNIPMHVYTHFYAHACTHVYTHVCMHVRTCPHTCLYTGTTNLKEPQSMVISGESGAGKSEAPSCRGLTIA